LGKGDKLEQVLQHGTEAGASAFVPIRAERCVADIPAAKTADKLARWQLITKGAAEQSGRSRIPLVHAPLTTTELLAWHSAECPVWLLHPSEESLPLRLVLEKTTTCAAILAVGPEGGWSPAEVSQARIANIPCVTLGSRILRTETAALVAVSQILYHFDV
jgi:16S rRNA (uracil1498-N3)-methyltransferase